MTKSQNESPLSIARLYDEAGKLTANMRRDLPQFIEYGVTENDVTVVEAAVQNILKLDTDESWIGWGVNATIACDLKKAELQRLLNEVSSKLKTYFGKSDAHQLQRLLIASGSLNHASLVTTTAALLELLNSEPHDFEAALIDSRLIDKLHNALDDYTGSINAKQDLFSNRKAATAARAEAKSELFAMIKKYSDFGKNIWKGVDESKMHDYMYLRSARTSPPKSGKKPTLTKASSTQSTNVSLNEVAA